MLLLFSENSLGCRGIFFFFNKRVFKTAVFTTNLAPPLLCIMHNSTIFHTQTLFMEIIVSSIYTDTPLHQEFGQIFSVLALYWDLSPLPSKQKEMNHIQTDDKMFKMYPKPEMYPLCPSDQCFPNKEFYQSVVGAAKQILLNLVEVKRLGWGWAGSSTELHFMGSV